MSGGKVLLDWTNNLQLPFYHRKKGIFHINPIQFVSDLINWSTRIKEGNAYFLTFCPGTRWQGESWGDVSKQSFNPWNTLIYNSHTHLIIPKIYEESPRILKNPILYIINLKESQKRIPKRRIWNKDPWIPENPNDPVETPKVLKKHKN